MIWVALFLSAFANFVLAFFLWWKKQSPPPEFYNNKDKEWLRESSAFKTQIEHLETKLKDQKNFYEEQSKKNLERERQNYNERLSEQKNQFEKSFERQKQEYDKRLEETRRNFEDRERYFKKLKIEFENISNQILKNKTESFQKESERSLGVLLNPLKEEIKKFEERYNKEAKERFSLKEEIKNIVNTNDRLTQALEGDAKTQGDWGEMVLEKILESSGLKQGRDFIVQGKGLNLKNEETGGRLRPDVIVNLPDNRFIVIDSKVSLTHYYNYTSAQSPEEKEKNIKGIVKSLENHIDSLSSKKYHKIEGLNTSDVWTPDFVLMFLPLEGALSLAIDHEKLLFNKAWEKSIAIVSPITLYSTLKIIHALWQIDTQNKNARKIALESGRLYDKFVHFIDNMKDIGSNLAKAQESHSSAFKYLKHGRGNLIGKVEKLKKLGAKTDKKLSVSEEDFEKDIIDKPSRSLSAVVEK